VLGHKGDVIQDLSTNPVHVVSLEFEELELFAYDLQVHIFETFVDIVVVALPVNDTSLQIKFTLSCLHILEQVAHEKDMDLSLILHMHSEYAIDPRNETILIVDEVVQVTWQHLDHDLLLTLIHGLDYEALVIRLEHEAATFTLGLLSLE
jgi:hypothetical protein